MFSYYTSGDVLRHLLACMVHGDSSEDLKTKAKRALKAILAKCTHLAALQPLLRDAPMKVQKYVLRQFSQLLPHDVEARRAFVQVRRIAVKCSCIVAVLTQQSIYVFYSVYNSCSVSVFTLSSLLISLPLPFSPSPPPLYRVAVSSSFKNSTKQ
jgi:hypothetical protein